MQRLKVGDVIGRTLDARVYCGGEFRTVKIHPIEAPGHDRNCWSSDPLIGRRDQPRAQGCRTSLAEWLSLGFQATGRGGGAAGRTAGWLAQRTTLVCAALSPNR
jgi:hypothetical protein